MTFQILSTRIRRQAVTFSAAALLATLALPGNAAAASHSVCASGCDYSTVRSAIFGASSGDTLVLEPETFFEGGLFINKNLALTTSSGQATVDGGASRYTFQVLPGKVVTFENLRLEGGTDCRLDNHGTTQLSTVYVIGDLTPSAFGGILNQAGFLTITDASVVAGNASDNFGGGITNHADLVVSNSTVTANSGHRGGGVYNYRGTVSIVTSSFSFNHAIHKGGAWANVSQAGSVAFHGSASTSDNTAGFKCDTFWNKGGSPSCVN